MPEAGYENWDEIPENLRLAIVSLGKFAFEKLLAGEYVFSGRELRSQFSVQQCLTLGLLVIRNNAVGKKGEQWQFSLPALQVWLATKFVISSGCITSGKVVKLVESIGPRAEHMHPFRTMLAALIDVDSLEALVNALIVREKCDNALIPMQIVEHLRLLSFPLNFHRILCQTLSTTTAEHLAELLLGAVVGGSGVLYVRSQMNCSRMPSGERFLKTLLETWVAEVPTASPEMLLSALSSLDESTSILCQELPGPATTRPRYSLPLAEDLCFYVADRGGSRRALAFQCFAQYAWHHNDHMASIPTISASLQHKNGLVYIRGDSDPALLCVLDTVLQHHLSAVTAVDLADFSSASPCKVPRSLTACPNVSSLIVSDCDPISLAVDIIVSSSLALRDLKLWGRLTKKDVELLSPAISTCRELENLAIREKGDGELSLDDMVLLSHALTPLTKLKSAQFLSVSVLARDEAVESLCGRLSSSTMLEGLEMRKCGLSAASLTIVARLLGCCTSVTTLNLSGNAFCNVLEQQQQQFIEAVASHRSLKQLDISVSGILPNSPLLCSTSYGRDLELVCYQPQASSGTVV